jgi:HD-GYP domain-containing protein (c-di-GMP phosphodiesterase class II)
LVSGQRFYIQGESAQYRKQLLPLVQELLGFFKQRKLGGLRFFPEIQNVSGADIPGFFRLLIRSSEEKEPAIWVCQQIEASEVAAWVSIMWENEIKRLDPNLRKKARTAYVDALNSLKQVAGKISLQGYAGLHRPKRAIQSMVDVVGQDESILLGMSTIKDYDDYTYVHSVNVAVLALCLGHRIGLSRISLEHLGICGVFHDLGKVELPREIVTKPGSLSMGEWKLIQKHPVSSVKQILNLFASHGLKSKILLAPFEHHINYDLTGYPPLYLKKRVSLFGRILHIADFYDAVTSPRVYRSFGLSPDQALNHMLKRAGTDFDPVLTKVFALMMGVYPVGTLVELDTCELGLVLDYPTNSGCVYPRIILLEKDRSGQLKRGELINLSEKLSETGAYRRNVVRSFNSAEYGIQAINFLF